MTENESGSRHLKRRVFLGRMAIKAAYIAPAVLALKAARTTYAGPSGCGQSGSPCAADGDCCAGFFCVKMNGMPCGGAMGCTCE